MTKTLGSPSRVGEAQEYVTVPDRAHPGARSEIVDCTNSGQPEARMLG